MNGSFKIELKDKTTGIAVKTVTVPAKITDYWKYESTYGFPGVNRTSYARYLLTLPFSSAGIQLFENTLDESRNKFRTKLSDTYIAYASRYNAAGNPEQYSSKAGHMKDYQLTTDFNQPATVGGQVTHTLKWSWGASQGNGTFKSLGTLNAQGAHAKDTTPILQNGAESLSPASAGQDFSIFCSCYSESGTGTPTYRTVNADSSVDMLQSSAWLRFDMPYVYARGSGYVVYSYQTDKNIVQLWFSRKNELQENNTYESEIHYRVVSKNDLHRFHLGQYSGLHPLSYNLNIYDSSFVINTGSQTLVTPSYTAAGTNGLGIQIEQQGYFVFFVKDSTTGNANPNPDGKTPLRPNTMPWYKIKTYVIKGDTPELISFSSVYDSALTAYIYASSQYTQITSWAGFIFTADFAYIYVDLQTRKLIKRYLSSDTFAWELSLTNPNNMLLYLLDDEQGCFGLCKYSSTVQTLSSTCLLQFTLLSQSNPNQTIGYIILPTYTSVPGRNYFGRQIYLWDYTVDSPFCLDAGMETTNAVTFASFARTDALFAKANLPEPITKTSDYTLDITLTLNIY